MSDINCEEKYLLSKLNLPKKDAYYEKYLPSKLNLPKKDAYYELVHDKNLVLDNQYDYHTDTIKQSMRHVESMKYVQAYVTRSVKKIPYDDSFCLELKESYELENGTKYDNVTLYDSNGLLIENQ